jgi:hypothetical protein
MSGSQRRGRKGFVTIDLAWNQVTKTSRNLKITKSLTKGQFNRIRFVRSGNSRGAIKHNEFLERVRDINPNYYTLCVIAFSQNQIDSTKAAVLDGLVKRIEERRGDQTVIHRNIQSLTADSNRVATDPSEGSWMVFTQSTIEGIRDVFGEDMMDKIKRVQRDKENDKENDNDNDQRVVTMHFPLWPALNHLDTCFLILDIREENVKELGMALFKVEVDWKTDGFRVVHHDGMVQTIPHFEFTLNGVLNEDIFAVFKSEICSATTEGPTRARELAEGKRRTESVSMIFSKSEATIHLTMGLWKGIEIQNRLNRKIVA